MTLKKEKLEKLIEQWRRRADSADIAMREFDPKPFRRVKWKAEKDVYETCMHELKMLMENNDELSKL